MSPTYRVLALGLITVFILPLGGCVAHDAEAISRQRVEERKKQYAAEAHYFARYDIALIEIDRPAQARDRYGEVNTHKVEALDGSVNQAEDGLIKIVWAFPIKEFAFELLNKTDNSLKIPWDEAAYVDISGQTHRVMHSGVKFADRNSPQAPSVVPSKGRLTDIIAPTDKVEFQSGQYGGWRQSNIFYCVKGYLCNESHKQLALAHKGQTYRLLLPLQVGSDMYNYTFVFRVSNVEIVSDKKEDPAKKAPEATP